MNGYREKLRANIFFTIRLQLDIQPIVCNVTFCLKIATLKSERYNGQKILSYQSNVIL